MTSKCVSNRSSLKGELCETARKMEPQVPQIGMRTPENVIVLYETKYIL